ncbi:hypothetical protein D1AOALGA4SA_5383 [Olavius algarvensis Delta 1 endosymbiont]|nr:hypothetical protein D1AOALGA4SA_5383 [Olavius algarvensis Delta 1 endosymbiont]
MAGLGPSKAIALKFSIRDNSCQFVASFKPLIGRSGIE